MKRICWILFAVIFCQLGCLMFSIADIRRDVGSLRRRLDALSQGQPIVMQYGEDEIRTNTAHLLGSNSVRQILRDEYRLTPMLWTNVATNSIGVATVQDPFYNPDPAWRQRFHDRATDGSRARMEPIVRVGASPSDNSKFLTNR
jgi:hypothetical protein